MSSDFGNLQTPSTLDPEKRQPFVTKLFDELAPDYDRFNRWVSFFRDEKWRRKTLSLLQEKTTGDILDLAAGTGDLSRSALEAGANQVHVFDISYNMLELAKSKLSQNTAGEKFFFEKGSAAAMPFIDESFDGIVSGFAMRNVFHFLDDVLAEMYRVLKPNGRFAILELSQPRNLLIRAGFRLHLKTVMPLIGRLTAGKSVPFKYLRETTVTFLSPPDFKKRLENSGFTEVGWKTFLFGGIAIHYGQKPAKKQDTQKS